MIEKILPAVLDQQYSEDQKTHVPGKLIKTWMHVVKTKPAGHPATADPPLC